MITTNVKSPITQKFFYLLANLFALSFPYTLISLHSYFPTPLFIDTIEITISSSLKITYS